MFADLWRLANFIVPNQLGRKPHRWYRAAAEFGENGLGGFCPDEGFGAGVVLGEISVDGGMRIGDRPEHTAADALPGYLREEILDRIARRPRTG
jgi:hypothetical protein